MLAVNREPGYCRGAVEHGISRQTIIGIQTLITLDQILKFNWKIRLHLHDVSNYRYHAEEAKHFKIRKIIKYFIFLHLSTKTRPFFPNPRLFCHLQFTSLRPDEYFLQENLLFCISLDI